MRKMLHNASKIFFDNPYVVMVQHDDADWVATQSASYKKILKHARLCIHGTWGYTQLKRELRTIHNSAPGATDSVVVVKSYWCFKDKVDALQFRLSVGETSMHVHMWPRHLFTIYEVDES